MVDRGTGALLRSSYEKTRTGQKGGLVNLALSRADRELIVFGSSRARSHYDPGVFRETLGLESFNAGCPGQGIAYARMLERLLLRRGTGAQVFLMQADAFDLIDDLRERASLFGPFYGEDPEIDHLLEAQSTTSRIKLLSHAYRFNSMAIPILRNRLLPAPDPPDGFVPEEGPGTSDEALRAEPAPETSRPVRPLLDAKVQLYEDFARDGAAAGVRVVLVASPLIGGSPAAREERATALSEFEALAERTGVEYLEVSERTEPAFRDVTLYHDPLHLNARGAELFSRKVAAKLEDRPGGRAAGRQVSPR